MFDHGICLPSPHGEWIKAQIANPYKPKIGDVEIPDYAARILRLVRNGQVVHETTFGAGVPFIPGPHTSSELKTEVIYWRSYHMASTATIENGTIDPATGQITVLFTGGSERTFLSYALLKEYVDEKFLQPQSAQDLALFALVYRSDDGSNLDSCNGLAVLIDGGSSELTTFSGLPPV